MKVAGIFWVTLACLPVSAVAGIGEAAVAGIGEAAGRTGQDSSSAVVDSRKGGGSKGRDAMVAISPRRGSTLQHGGAQLARSGADSLRSMLSAKPRGRLAKASSRPIGSNRAATGGSSVVRNPRGPNPLGGPAPTVSKNAAHAMASMKAVGGGSSIGHPHPAGLGRLGGSATGRTANSATINGAQLHRKL